MNYFVVALVIAVAFAAKNGTKGEEAKSCSDVNQVWSDCGSYCERTCIQPEDQIACAAVCVPKCKCKPGYIIGPNGNCITDEECTSILKCPGENEFWNNCGSNCEPACVEPKEPKYCPAVCISKCSCKPGFVRSQKGKCIKRERCGDRSCARG